MNISTLVGLTLLLAALGVVSGKSSHSRDYSLEDTDDSNRMIVQSSFKMAIPLFLRNAIDSSTQATPPTTTTQTPCETLTCQNGGTLKTGTNGSCPACECRTVCYGKKCEACIPNPTTTVPTNGNCSIFVCLNGGILIQDESGCRCNCLNGFHGDTCATSTSHRPTTTSLAPITTTSSKPNGSFIDIGTWYGRVAILKNQNYVATGGWTAEVGLRIYDLRNKQLVRTLNSSNPWVYDLKPFKENQLIQVSISNINIWNVETGELVRTLDLGIYRVSIALNKNQSLMLTSDNGFNVILWDLVEYKQIRTFTGHTSQAISVIFNEASNQVISGSYQSLIVWNMNDGSLIRTLTGHYSNFYKLLIDEETGLLYGCSSDTTIKEWSIQNGTVLRTFTGHTSSVEDLIWSEDGQRLISASFDKSIIIWNKRSGEIINRLNHTVGLHQLALNPLNGQLLSTASYSTDSTYRDTRLQFWPLIP